MAKPALPLQKQMLNLEVTMFVFGRRNNTQDNGQQTRDGIQETADNRDQTMDNTDHTIHKTKHQTPATRAPTHTQHATQNKFCRLAGALPALIRPQPGVRLRGHSLQSSNLILGVPYFCKSHGATICRHLSVYIVFTESLPCQSIHSPPPTPHISTDSAHFASKAHIGHRLFFYHGDPQVGANLTLRRDV